MNIAKEIGNDFRLMSDIYLSARILEVANVTFTLRSTEGIKNIDDIIKLYNIWGVDITYTPILRERNFKSIRSLFGLPIESVIIGYIIAKQ